MQALANINVKRVLLALAGLLVALGFVWALWPQPIAVDVAVVSRGPLTVTVDEEGKTRIRQVYAVSAPITGKLQRLALQPGDPVIKGETVVAIIEPTVPPLLDVRTTREQTAQVEAARAFVVLAEAEVRAARTDLQFAESELARAETLQHTQAIAERALEKARIDVDMRKAALARALANLEMRKRELESAEARLLPPDEAYAARVPASCCVRVLAPESGRILKLIQESEKVVEAGSLLVEIGDPSNIEIVVELLSAEAVRVPEGADALIEAWGGRTPLKARVRRVEPAGFTKVSALGIEEQRVRVILDLVDGARTPERLGHDYRVFVRINVYAADDVVRVPVSALFRRGEKWAVFVVDRGRAQTVEIELGERNATFAEVRKGLQAGARVIVHPSDRVGDGVRVAETLQTLR
ncbi:MAG: efflux RND transporter periplasmic adaptor subunit [Hyphomicrobiaceae bacterium]